jgi:hypothetical protein
MRQPHAGVREDVAGLSRSVGEDAMQAKVRSDQVGHRDRGRDTLGRRRSGSPANPARAISIATVLCPTTTP